MSVQSTHSSSVSIHSTTQTTTTTTTVAAADSAEDILSIENTLEQVAAAASQNNTATTANTARTRAGFNSISDAIGNLRTRLNRHTSSSSSSSNNNATGGAGSHHHGSMLQRLQHRLHTIDAAHSSRIPLHVMESRSRRNVSVPNIRFGTNNAATIAEGEEKSASMDEDNNANENTTTPPPPLHVSATIFSIDTRETTHYEESTTSTTSSTTTRPTLQQHRRSSVLFASRIVANRSIMEGTSNMLLASGGTHGQRTSRRDLLGDRGLSVTGSSLRDFEMHVHPSVSRRMLLSPISGGSSEHSGSETTVTTSADAKDDGLLLEDEEEESMEVDLSDMEVEEEKEEEKEKVTDTKNKLYSWGKGIQSLHDDSNDRIIPTLNDDSDSENNNNKKINTELLVVTSRLDSKSILSVSTSQHSSACATSLGTVYVAGRNVHGCVDPNAKDNEVISRPMLLDCLGNIRVVQVSCGYDHTAVLSSNGSVVSTYLYCLVYLCHALHTCV